MISLKYCLKWPNLKILWMLFNKGSLTAFLTTPLYEISFSYQKEWIRPKLLLWTESNCVITWEKQAAYESILDNFNYIQERQKKHANVSSFNHLPPRRRIYLSMLSVIYKTFIRHVDYSMKVDSMHLSIQFCSYLYLLRVSYVCYQIPLCHMLLLVQFWHLIKCYRKWF